MSMLQMGLQRRAGCAYSAAAEVPSPCTHRRISIYVLHSPSSPGNDGCHRHVRPGGAGSLAFLSTPPVPFGYGSPGCLLSSTSTGRALFKRSFSDETGTGKLPFGLRLLRGRWMNMDVDYYHPSTHSSVCRDYLYIHPFTSSVIILSFPSFYGLKNMCVYKYFIQWYLGLALSSYLVFSLSWL